MINITDLLKRPSIQHTGILYAAILFNTLLGYIAVKINTHYLTTVEFGYYSFFITTITLSHAFFSFGLFESTSRLLAVSKSQTDEREYFGTTILTTFLLGVIYALFLVIWSFLNDLIFQVKISTLLFRFAPLALFFMFQNMFIIVLRGCGKINHLAIFTFSPRLLYVAGMLLFVALGSFNLNTTVSLFLTSILLISLLFTFLLKPVFSNVIKRWTMLIEEIRTFGIHLYIANIISMVIQHADKFILAYFVTAEQLAYYALAYTISVPLLHFSTAISRAQYKKFANAKSINPRIIQLNTVIVATAVTIVILAREFIILKLFSEKFEPSIPVLVILSFAFGIAALSAPYTMFFKSKGMGKSVRNITLQVQVVLIAGTLILIPRFGINGAAIAVFIGFLYDYIAYLFSYQRYFRKA